MRQGTREINVGRLAVGRFKGLTLGSDVKFGSTTWKVVGIFTADDASFESELWGDVDLMMPAFQRNGYQSMTVKLADPSMFDSFKTAVEGDPRLYLQPQREQEYYAEQSRAMTTVIRVFGTFVTLILAIGAVFGAMNTMYAAVAYHAEIGTLRALGFSRLAHRDGVSCGVDRAGAARRRPRLFCSRCRCTGCRPARPTSAVSVKSRSKFKITPALLAGGLVFSRGDGSSWRPAPGDSRGPHPSRPSAARDLIVLPNIIQISPSSDRQASALLVFTVPFRWPLVAVGRRRISCAPSA